MLILLSKINLKVLFILLINMIHFNNNNIHYNLYKLLDIIIYLGGNIFGEFVREFYIHIKLLQKNDYSFNFNKIDILFPNNNTIKYFFRIIKDNFEIYRIDNFLYNYKSFNLVYNYLDGTIYKSTIITLNLFSCNSIFSNKKTNICYLTQNLDCNQLTFNHNSMNLIHNYDSLFYYNNPNTNNFLIIFNRITNKKFAQLLKFSTISKTINSIDYSYNLVNNGWIMDDTYYKNNIFILFKWSNRDFNNYRTTYNFHDYDKLKSCNNCTICGSKFNDNCIVFNTNCNHNFHWYCNHDKNIQLGLKNWLVNFNNNCPICREPNII